MDSSIEIINRNNKENDQNEKNEKSKEKKNNKSTNWSSAEEVTLAEAFLYVSQQPEVGTNQTGEEFMQKVTDRFNDISTSGHRDFLPVKIKWASLKTATIKFSGIMTQIENNPPSGTVQTDWPELAIEMYDKTSTRGRFKSLAAWRILSTCPKWMTPRPPPGPLAMSIAGNIPSSDSVIDSGDITPRASTPPRPEGSKKTKRKRIQDAKDAKAAELELTREEHLIRANDLAERRVKAMEEGNELTKKMSQVDAEAKASLVQVNELKVLMTPEDENMTPLAKEVLALMQNQLKEKYSNRAPSTSSTSASATQNNI